MKYIPPLDSIVQRLNYVCLGWSTDDGVHYTLEQQNARDFISPFVGECFGIKPLSAVESVGRGLQFNQVIESFTSQLAWQYHRFYIDRFVNLMESTDWTSFRN